MSSFEHRSYNVIVKCKKEKTSSDHTTMEIKRRGDGYPSDTMCTSHNEYFII